MPGKLKLAVYWGASCGGCEIAVLEIGERVLDLVEVAEFVFWPCVMDFKVSDVEAMDDGYIDVCLFNGGIRNVENREMAELLRRKSKVLVAYGACAADGGIPALGNLYATDGLMERAFLTSESTDNPDGLVPGPGNRVPEGEIRLPALLDAVKRLEDVVRVDYRVPGCPPTEAQTWAVVSAVAEAAVKAGGVIEAVEQGLLPTPPAVLGAGRKTVCDQCERERRGVRIAAFHRPHTHRPEPGWCLLEQGIVCHGPATRSGCEARCLDADLPCRGCYGPAGGLTDQGASVLSAVGSMIDARTVEQARAILADLVDPAGTAWRFGMGSSTLRRRLPEPEEA